VLSALQDKSDDEVISVIESEYEEEGNKTSSSESFSQGGLLLVSKIAGLGLGLEKILKYRLGLERSDLDSSLGS